MSRNRIVKQLGRGCGEATEEYAAEQGRNKTMLQWAHLCSLISSLEDLLPGFLSERFIAFPGDNLLFSF